MDSLSGTVVRAEDGVSQSSSPNGEDSEDGSDSQQPLSQSRHRAPMMIDWRRKICSFLSLPSTCTDDEIIEELEIKDKLLRESESLKRLAFSTQGPPRVQIINRITCQDSGEHGLYLDEPWLVENGPYRAHLRCSRLVDNLELYLERNKDIVCIAYRDCECCGRAPPVPDPSQFELLVRENIDIVSHELRVAWGQLVVAVTEDASTNLSRDTFDLEDANGRVQETRHPYLWWFQHRSKIERAKSHLGQESKNQVEAFQQYLKLYLGDEWAKVDSLIRLRKSYMAQAPGQIIISKLKGQSVAQWQAYTATSWLAIIGSPPAKGNFQALIQVSYWDFDGNFQRLYSTLDVSALPSLTEEFPINTLMVFPMKYVDNGTVRNLRQRGQMFWECRHRKYVCVRGTPEDHLYGANSGSQFMIDRATFRQMHPPSTGQQAPVRYRDDLGPEIMAQDEPLPDLGDGFYMCLPTSLYGFNMQKKDWVKLEVDLLQEPFGQWLVKGMSNNQQMLGQVITRSGAKTPAGSPITIKRHLLSAGRRIGTRQDTGGILKKGKATKTKTDDKTGISWDTFKELDHAKVDDIDLGWKKMMPAARLAEVRAEGENMQVEAYAPEPASEYAPRKVSLDSYSASTPGLRPIGLLEVENGFHLHRPDEPLASHRSTYKLADCGLRNTHYTISQDHTSGQEAHEDSLLASFGKRRRTDKPSILLNGSKLLQRSPYLLPSLANGDNAVAQNEGSGIQKESKDALDFLKNWKPIDSQMPQDALVSPPETVINNTGQGKHRGDEVEFKWGQGRSRRAQPYELQKYLRRQDRDTSLFDKSAHTPPASLNRQCPGCNRIDSGEWRGGRDGAFTICDACGLHYKKL
ncbi:aaa family atpase [Fusarium tjaetaba]|uniref:Aaa family atpase n=1 Tax=Fusarium tjaetaba TaxID=1567544 RepID=A0A8H5VCU8_9HYPO|nr:aaa family atpase [Fusarium tjaetaba]KAF5618856.1 aaa family atpase [Fusarium tjaetaba]